MSLRLRLTLAVVGLLALTVAGVGVATVVATRQVLTDQVDELLRATELRQGGPAFARDRRPPILAAEEGGEDGTTTTAPYTPVAQLLVDTEGTVVRAAPAGFGDDPLPVPETVDVEPIAGTIRTLEVDGVRYRATARQVRTPDGEQAVVLLAPLTEVDDSVAGLVVVVAVAGLAALVVGGGLSWWAIGRSLAPVDRMIDTASAIAGGDLSRRVEHAEDGTELGRLATALDDMLAQLEASFAQQEASEARLRQFVADASHELRTPLAAVGGYAELYRSGGLPDDEAVARAMARIEGESARMARLVEDLLTLARLDQAQPLERHPVDLATVAADVVADASVVDPDHPVDLEAGAPAVVTGDEARLRQVLTNLCTNARVHTPAGTPVHVRVGHEGDHVVVRVVDEGPGMAPEVRARAFERFFRADVSRSRATGGTGLGLSIVAAVVAAHGGSVGVEDTPGGGTTVVVRLPRTAPAPPAPTGPAVPSAPPAP